MSDAICLDEKYSTTRLIFNAECLMANEKEDNLKLKIKNSTFALPEGEKYLKKTTKIVLNQTYTYVEYAC